MIQKTEKIYVKGPYWPNNSYIVLRIILNGDIESKVKVISRPNRNQASLFATELCKKRNVPFGGYMTANFMEKEPR